MTVSKSKIHSFRIKNYRSIIDSGWIFISPDDVTVFIGQNESGKSAILEALAVAVNGKSVAADDLRIGADGPETVLRINLSDIDFDSFDRDIFSDEQIRSLQDSLSKNEFIEITCTWHPEVTNDKLEHKFKASICDSSVDLILSELNNPTPATLTEEKTESQEGEEKKEEIQDETDSESPASNPSNSGETTPAEPTDRLSADDLAHEIHAQIPFAVLFNAASGTLPSQVDIDSKNQPNGQGSQAAANFIAIADLDISALVKGDTRYRENVLKRASQRVSDEFRTFWSQIIGAGSRISLECEIKNYSSAENPEKAGQPHLVFWISDGVNKLYPKQRSLGVRWFVSFYLQLRASEKRATNNIYLLDEPGANLHERAQRDVLKLINDLKSSTPILYSTHSPEMIEHDKIYRIRAVQRDGSNEESPTVVIDASLLAQASTDTLSPLYHAMGTNLSKQTTIKKDKNVLLEELSGYYYLKAFWLLTKEKTTAHFIAATGVNKIPQLANMFLGWGLDFIVAVDDDQQGRSVYKQLKQDLFGDNQELANRRLIKIPGGTCIEDIFEQGDFKKFVLKDPDCSIEKSNADYLKEAKLSKIVTALNFYLDVTSEKIKFSAMTDSTKENIEAAVKSIASRLVE